jgi:hypothetical protein
MNLAATVETKAEERLNGKPAQEDIMQALVDSGYLMEQEVASRFEAIGYHVQTNRAFEDEDEGKSREMDVSAFRRVHFDEENKIVIDIEFIVECKNSTNPFAFITRRKNQIDRQEAPRELIFSRRTYQQSKTLDHNRSMSRQVSAFLTLGIDNDHYYFKNQEKSVQFCRIDRKGSGWQANHGGIFDSILFPLIKAFEARRKTMKSIQGPSTPDEWHVIALLVPTVVIRGDLFTIDSTLNEPKPTPISHVTLMREIKSKTLSGKFLIEFVAEKEIENFVQQKIEALAASVQRAVYKDVKEFKNPIRPWKD